MAEDEPSPRPNPAETHGYTTHRRPLTVLHARTLNDIRTIAHFTSKHDLPPANRHPTNGKAHTPTGVILTMTTLTPIRDPHNHHATIPAGTRWSEILNPPWHNP